MYKVIKTFVDRETKVRYEIDTEYTPSSEERARELVEKGFIKKVNKPRRNRRSDES